MVERYGRAAEQHIDAGDRLRLHNMLDDAGYHFGVSGENSVKYALEVSGMQSKWVQDGAARGLSRNESLMGTPMRGHFPRLKDLIVRVRSEIAINATGRHAAPILAKVLSTSFDSVFSGWDIQIRYADTTCTPISPADCTRWKADAEDLFSSLVI